MLFSEPKIPQFYPPPPAGSRYRVSVLFSEPKIPQCTSTCPAPRSRPLRFSALQRAENSSIPCTLAGRLCNPWFQCSSASRKFLNQVCSWRRRTSYPVSVLFSEPKIPQCDGTDAVTSILPRFSALQRAENSSIPIRGGIPPRRGRFQCSSASRKFLNSTGRPGPARVLRSFSALQRAENSSISWCVMFICYKIRVSVLFSEPKIPQSNWKMTSAFRARRFSALQRAENSSIKSERR